MIIDLGDNIPKIRKANALRLGDMIILPICMGCGYEIEDGKEYYSSTTAALTSHVNGFCLEFAKKNQLEYLNNL